LLNAAACTVHLSPRAGRGRRASVSEARRVRGRRRESERVEMPPHPDPLPARGEREKGRGGVHHFSLRLPEPYSLSSQTTHLPSWATYFVISGTVFCPWSSNVTGPMMES